LSKYCGRGIVSINVREPVITVGIADMQPGVTVRLNGNFVIEGIGTLSGPFHASADSAGVLLFDEEDRLVTHSPSVHLVAHEGSTFRISDVTIGIRFHWERREDQVFQGNLILSARDADNITIINKISLEDYLVSVISSEMSGTAPHEFLKVHSIISRSWLLAALDRKNITRSPAKEDRTDELIRWYNREDHDIFDVCADDHCQRYQGITRIISDMAADAVAKTHGCVLAYGDNICDARYFKACGGITENYETAWEDTPVPYLVSISDSQNLFAPVVSEDTVVDWISGSPDVYCNTKDEDLLAEILPGFDRETTQFFRWKVEYTRSQLEDIIRQKSGIDFGTLYDLTPLERGPSGRIKRLKITGSKQSITIGKELEIRRWLSPTHLYSSCFIVSVRKGPDGHPDSFTFNGAGWGHGVGLCQIGAAVMAKKGFTAEEILGHYFTGAEIKKIY
jgi:stage II sporulation protein D